MRTAIQIFTSESKKYSYMATIESNTRFEALLKFVRSIKKESPNAPIYSVGYMVLLNK